MNLFRRLLMYTSFVGLIASVAVLHNQSQILEYRLSLVESGEEPTQEDRASMSDMMKYTVRIKKGGGGGSGVVIYSEKDRGTLILTNSHVVSVSLRGRSPVFVEIMEYDSEMRSLGWATRSATLIQDDQEKDLALLLLDDKSTVFKCATMWPVSRIQEVDIFDQVWVCGATGGGEPLMSTGMITSKRRKDSNGINKWVCTAPISFGNSGGPAFALSEDGTRYELIGIVNSIGSANGMPLAHLNMFIPMPQIMEFLEESQKNSERGLELP